MELAQIRDFAADVAKSRMFGITDASQAICLMMICQSEGIDPILALKRYHLIEGKPSMRADAMQGEFMARGGTIVFHVRTDDMVAATLFADKAKVDDAARKRAADRFATMWLLDSEEEPTKRGELILKLAENSRDGEETIIRTFADSEAKGLTTSYKDGKPLTKHNWKTSPRQMLTARVITEGVRLIDPGLIAGIYTPDEVEDIVRQEVEQPRLTDGKASRDRDAILKMMEQHMEEVRTAKPERKRELLGLVSELRCELGDLESGEDEIPGLRPNALASSAAPVAPPGDGEPELITDDPRATQEAVVWSNYTLQHIKIAAFRGRRLDSLTREEITALWQKMPKGAFSSENTGIRDEANFIKEAYEARNPVGEEAAV